MSMWRAEYNTESNAQRNDNKHPEEKSVNNQCYKIPFEFHYFFLVESLQANFIAFNGFIDFVYEPKKLLVTFVANSVTVSSILVPDSLVMMRGRGRGKRGRLLQMRMLFISTAMRAVTVQNTQRTIIYKFRVVVGC